MESTKQKQNTIFDTLKDAFAYRNVMQTPKITKITVSTGVGSTTDKEKMKLVADRLVQITGQKAAPRAAKKSIATFKLREGDVVGYSVTLRGERMYAFLDKLLNVVIPRTRDFKGIKRSAIDEMGNLTIGIKEHIIFPETSDEELRNVFGLAVTLTTTAKNKAEAEKLFEELGVPFKKKEEK